MKSLITALALTLGLTTSAFALDADQCKPDGVAYSALMENWNKPESQALANGYGIVLHDFTDAVARQFIDIANEINPSNPYPGTISKVTRIVVFQATGEEVPRSRVFIYAGDDCLLFQVDWPKEFVKKLINELEQRNV